MTTEPDKAGSTGEVSITQNGPIVTLTLANPARRNAISESMWRALRASTTTT